jgi:hypothetical protein
LLVRFRECQAEPLDQSKSPAVKPIIVFSRTLLGGQFCCTAQRLPRCGRLRSPCHRRAT